MKRVLFLIATMAMFTTLFADGLAHRVDTLETQVAELQTQPPAVDGVDGTNGTNGTDGSDGIDGVDTDSCELYELLTQTASSNAALGSVELNPDRTGWSVGVGFSNRKGDAAAAVGVMYGVKYDTGVVKSVGYNIKAYNAESAYRGATVGFTLGF